jgi:zinc transporter 1/2/3
MMNPELVKLLLALVIFIIGFIGGSLPWIIPSLRHGGRILALGNTFSAGVIGGAGLVHLLEGGIDGFRKAVPEVHYPLALTLAGLSFLFILLIEVIIIRKYNTSGSYRHTGSTHEITPTRFSDFSQIQALILLSVLSIHSLILGFTLGVQQTMLRMSIVFTAIISHKLFAGFALGVGYMRSGFSWRKAIVPILFFAVMVPSGVLIASIAGATFPQSTALWFESIFDSIGAGTFLYIASVDIISTEFHDPFTNDRMLKWFLTVAGFGLMAILALWV